MNILKISFSLLFTSSLFAVDWAPEFKDPPVTPKLKAAVEAALPSEAIVPPKEPRKILIYSATSGYRHKAIPLGKFALEAMAESTGAYEAVISDDPTNFEAEKLKDFDAVVLLNTTSDFFMPALVRNPKTKKREIPTEFSPEDWAFLKARNDRLVDNLVAYVKGGGGLMGIHSATDSCYGHEGYGDMIGAYFDGHPWRANMDVTITVEDPEHGTIQPVFGDIEEFSFKEEIYQFKEEPYSRDKLRILLHLNVEKSDQTKGLKRSDNDYAVAWVQAVGEGRVFYTSIGHNDHIYTNPLMLKHYLAGIQFAVGDLEGDTTPSSQR